VLPGHLNDLNVARELVLVIVRPYAEGMPVLADGGYNGAGRGVLTPVRSAPTASRFTPTSAPTTSAYGEFDASSNEDSPCSSDAGKPCAT
jgi:hypothetical protein